MAQDTGQQVTTTSSEPWGPQADKLKFGFGQAHKLYEQGPLSYYPGQTYAPFAPETEQALTGISGRAAAGSPLMPAAGGLARKTLEGGFLGEQNPYLNQRFQTGVGDVSRAFRESVVPSVNSTFSLAGRYGSNQHRTAMNQAEESLGRSLASMWGDIYAPAYESERGRQMQTLGMAPALAGADYADFEKMAQVGAAREGLEQQRIVDQAGRYNFGQNAPNAALEQYMRMITGAGGGGTSTSSTPIYKNTPGSILGGGLAGGSLFGPWGALIGGGLGAFM